MINNLQQLYIDQLRDLFSAETQLIAALPDMAANATDESLRDAFNHHLDETRTQRARLQEIFGFHSAAPEGEDCDAMRGLIKEATKHVANTEMGSVRDAVLIASGNRVEHYEIAAYGTARAFAQTLGETKVADLLQETLDEEGETDKKLTALAETINEEANAADEENEDEE